MRARAAREHAVDLVDVWEAANRDDLFAVTSLKHYPYIASSDFHKPKHLHSWKTLIRAEKDWESIKEALRSNVDIAITLYRNGAWNRKEKKGRKGAAVPVPARAAG